MNKILLTISILLLTPQTASAQNIEITEIHPNPEGTDKGNEWIEVYNPSQFEINLEDYKINKKPLKNKTISPSSYTTITSIPLKNSKNSIELTTAKDFPISKITYDNVEEGKSYTKALINNSSIWLWTKPTKSLPNPTFRKLTGRITSPPEKNHFYFNNLKIYFTNDFSLQLLKVLFKQDQQLQIVISSKKELVKFKILSSSKIKNNFKEKGLIPYITTILGAFLGILISTSSPSSNCKECLQTVRESSVHLDKT